ncbi:transcriptional regulator, LysR family [Methylococcus capsulatus str. Bath]|uniref:Transcriptional regulator, LysR family n=1 Tax=Methylococcus capsulatus (strain ATCC 33009 / NCIMB 11132 / Bath) TaxID=243233 RepID=Q60A71_METCA|nr:LysR family transcriptional regulator [Methylococcus capsulatus]AAU92940.1 transcriptional regulator, LysR family [Methylococcus capsulatus str. Bath]
MRFDLKDLELFVAATEAGSIAKAAERCHTVASAVSKRLSDLEAAYGTALLLRSSKGIAPTAAGLALLGRARAVLHQAGQLEQELRGYSKGLRGRVRVFANISAIVEFLPSALASFLAAHPEIEVELEERVSTDIAEAVAESRADLGILSELPSGSKLVAIPFREDELVLLVRPDHTLAARGSAGFGEALDSDFVGLHTDGALHYLMLRAAAEARRPLKLKIQVTGFDAVCAMVAAGLGIGVIPRAAAAAYTASLGLVAVALEDAWSKRRLHICLRSKESLSAASRLLLDHLTGLPS